MRVAGNKLRHLLDYFHNELKDKFEKGEIDAMFSLAVEKYLGLRKQEIQKKLEENINQSDLLLLYDCAKDLAKDIPIQYILKQAWFYDLPFYVTPSVLIPRPETEELVELILKENKSPGSLFDIGTGSGCIPVTIKKHRPDCNVFATDISEEALLVASENAAEHKVLVNYVQGDILNEDILPDQRFDIIVSNPPYILSNEKNTMQQNVLAHEPHLALFVKGSDPILFYRKIIDYAAQHLNPGGRLYFELNPLTAAAVKQYATEKILFTKIELRKDLSGKERFLVAERIRMG